MRRTFECFLARVAAGLALLALSGCASLGSEGGGGALVPADLQPEAAVLQRAQFTEQDGEAARNEALYVGALRRMPNDAETWFRLGNLYAAHHRPEAAAAAYGRALRANNADARALHNLGVVRLRQAYAALLQGQTMVSDDEQALGVRIERLLQELASVSVLGDGDAKAAPAKPEGKP